MSPRRIIWAAAPATLLIVLPVLVLLANAFLGPGGALDAGRLRILAFSSRQLTLLGNTFAVSSGAAALALFLGVPLAFLIGRTDLPGRRVFSALYLVPLLVPPFLHAIVWTRCLDPALARLFGLPPGLAQGWSVSGLPGGVLVFALAYSPLATLVVLAGLRGLDRNAEEAAILARGPRAAFFRVTLPLVAPHIACSAILVFLFAMVNFEVADIVRLKVYPLEIFLSFSAYYDEKTATVLALPLIGAAMALLLVQMLIMRGRSYVEWGHGPGARIYGLGRARAPGALFGAGVLGLGLFLPLGFLALGAGGWSTYARVLRHAGGAVANSLYLAGAGALAATACSLVVAHAIVRSRGPARAVVDYLTRIPLGVPSIVLGIGAITTYNREGLDWVYGSSLVVVLALVSAYAPFVIRVVEARLRQVSPEMEEAGVLAGRSRVAVFFRIVLPMAAPGLASGAFVAYVLCLSNLGTVLLLLPPGFETAPVAIYNFMHYGAHDAMFALSLVLLAAAGLPPALFWLAAKAFAAWRKRSMEASLLPSEGRPS